MLDDKCLALNTTDRKLLYGIYKTLQEIRELLVAQESQEPDNLSVVSSAVRGMDADYNGLSRKQLMNKMQMLENKPAGWSRLNNSDLINLLRAGG